VFVLLLESVFVFFVLDAKAGRNSRCCASVSAREKAEAILASVNLFERRH
jgi:hypothetical protein